jgi:NAD(P)-dependent dehydrogenase (short-subunit alcohol dehydrogenase family)
MSITKVCIVTGSSAGLGLATAKKLVAKDFHVIFACRDEVKTMLLLQKLKQESGRSNFEFMKLDLGSFDSIKQFVADFHSKGLPLNLLINNAGVVCKNFKKSNDGIEYTFAVNHLGHFLLTNLLLDDLKRSAPSRVVVVSSKLHDPNRRLGNPPNFKWDLDEINNEMGYDGMVAYKNSKLANVWFSYELARRLENTGVDVHVICPV